MARIKLYTRNILEDGTVTVTGTADTGYPKSRLYDRAISLYWKDTVTEAKTFHVDQGASGNESVDALLIPKHNFNGEDMAWQYSANNSDWTDAVTGWTQGDNNQIEKTLSAALTKRYWRVTLASMENPQCSEIFMSYGYEFTADFVQNPEFGGEPNVIWTPTIGGLERSTKLGEERRTRAYALFLEATHYLLTEDGDSLITEDGHHLITEKSGSLGNFRAAMADLDGYSKPFYFKDHEGNYFMAKFAERPKEVFITEGHVQVVINVVEML
jgi:hypothetical protein